ncbi:c-type cytochrome [Candidatus Enterovibrio escicola]|uniref:c-type cytochrome n=1 Tax=Candidatus Enterovibrio escicola TaxID=1927127 RepID=UPI001237A537|nr:cytochrome c5 family protein [Candidatus Enterovibrio escacola]
MKLKGILLRRLMLSTVATISLIDASHSADMSEKATAERIAPVGSVYLKGEVFIEDTILTKEPRTGSVVYNTYCMACHHNGVGGAPVVGDTVAWEPRISQGMEVLTDHVFNGFNGMPARGACMDCSSEEIVFAIEYMFSL